MLRDWSDNLRGVDRLVHALAEAAGTGRTIALGDLPAWLWADPAREAAPRAPAEAPEPAQTAEQQPPAPADSVARRAGGCAGAKRGKYPRDGAPLRARPPPDLPLAGGVRAQGQVDARGILRDSPEAGVQLLVGGDECFGGRARLRSCSSSGRWLWRQEAAAWSRLCAGQRLLWRVCLHLRAVPRDCKEAKDCRSSGNCARARTAPASACCRKNRPAGPRVRASCSAPSTSRAGPSAQARTSARPRRKNAFRPHRTSTSRSAPSRTDLEDDALKPAPDAGARRRRRGRCRRCLGIGRRR